MLQFLPRIDIVGYRYKMSMSIMRILTSGKPERVATDNAGDTIALIAIGEAL
jgi:hypothetical protein